MNRRAARNRSTGAAGPALLVAAAVALTLLPSGASLGAGDAGVSLSGLSRTAAWLVVGGTAMILLAAAATRRSVPLRAWAIPALAVALAVARAPVILAPRDWETWLTAPLADLARFDVALPADRMEIEATAVIPV